MATIEESAYVETENRKKIYLQRVNQLYANIRNWLKDENLVFSVKPTEIYEELGHYIVPFLSIKTADGELLAEMKPAGTAVIMAEGLIEVIGFDNDYVEYLLAGGPTVIDPTGKKRFIYQGIDVDGWYWNHRLKTNPTLINDKTSFLEMITWVSDHEFI